MFFLLAAKKPLAVIITAFVVVDLIVASALIASDLGDCNIIPNGVKFGFYKSNETRG